MRMPSTRTVCVVALVAGGVFSMNVVLNTGLRRETFLATPDLWGNFVFFVGPAKVRAMLASVFYSRAPEAQR